VTVTADPTQATDAIDAAEGGARPSSEASIEGSRPTTSPPARVPVDEPASSEPIGRRRVAVLAALWFVMTLVCLTLVVYALEPLFVNQTQSELLATYRSQIEKATKETQGLPVTTGAAKAPESGAPVAIVEIGSLHLRQVVVEGVSSSQTQSGPGHVPGTAGAGQPGNSAIVGRRGAFGGPFGNLGRLHTDDTILVTTTQGQVVYRVTSVGEKTITRPSEAELANASVFATATAEPDDSKVAIDTLFGPTDDDRLTLVTSASDLPWNSSQAMVVTATMDGQPFVPTAQGGRTDGQSGTSGDPSAWAPFVLALLAFAAAAVGAVLLYRRSSRRVAYLLTTPALVVFVILAAETGSRLLPAWM